MGVRLGFLLLSYAVLVSGGLIALSMMFALMNTHIARSSSEMMIKNSLERNARTLSSWSSSYEYLAQRTALGLLHLGFAQRNPNNQDISLDPSTYRKIWAMIGIAEMARGSVSSTFEMWRLPSPIDDDDVDDDSYDHIYTHGGEDGSGSDDPSRRNTLPHQKAKTVLWHSTGCSHIEQRCHLVDIKSESVTYIGADPARDLYYFDDVEKVKGFPSWYDERVSFLNKRNVGPRGLWSPLYIDLLHDGPATCDPTGVRGRIVFYYCLTPKVIKLGVLSDEELAMHKAVRCDHVLGMEADLGAVITANSLAFTPESTAHLRSVDVVDYTNGVCALNPSTLAVMQRYLRQCEGATPQKPCHNLYEFTNGDVVSVTGLFTPNNLRLIAVDTTPESYFFYVARRVRRVTVAIAVVLIAAVVVLSVAVWMSIVTPIHRICRGMKLASKLTSENMGDMSHFTWIAEIKLLYNSYLNLRNALMELRAFVPQGLFVAPSPGALQSNSVLDMLMGVHDDDDEDDMDEEEEDIDYESEEKLRQSERHDPTVSAHRIGSAKDPYDLSHDMGTSERGTTTTLRRDAAAEEDMCGTECFWHEGPAVSKTEADFAQSVTGNMESAAHGRKRRHGHKAEGRGGPASLALDQGNNAYDTLRESKHVTFGTQTSGTHVPPSNTTANTFDDDVRKATSSRGRDVGHVLRDFVRSVSTALRRSCTSVAKTKTRAPHTDVGDEHVHTAHAQEAATVNIQKSVPESHSDNGGIVLPRHPSMTETSVFHSATNTPRATGSVAGGAAVLPPSLLYSEHSGDTMTNGGNTLPALALPVRPAHNTTSVSHYTSMTSDNTVGGANEGRSETTLNPSATTATAAPCLRLDLCEYHCNTFRRVDCSVIVLALDFRYANSERLSEQVELLMHVAVKAVVKWGGVLELLRPNMIIATFGAHSQSDEDGAIAVSGDNNSDSGGGTTNGVGVPQKGSTSANNTITGNHTSSNNSSSVAVKTRSTQHAELAVACGVTIMRRLRPEQRAQTRLFVDSSAFYVGNCGAHGRVAPVVFGDRLDFAVDVMKYELSLGRLLLTDSVALSLPGSFVVPIDYLVTLHNRSHGIQIFQFIDHGPRRTAAFRARVSRFRDAYTEAVRGEYAAALRELHAGPLYDTQVGTHFAHALRYLMALQPRRPRYCRFQLPPFEPLGMATKERAMRFQYEKIRLHDISSTTAPTAFIHFGFDEDDEDDHAAAGGVNEGGNGGTLLQITETAHPSEAHEKEENNDMSAHAGSSKIHKSISPTTSPRQPASLTPSSLPHLSAFETQAAAAQSVKTSKHETRHQANNTADIPYEYQPNSGSSKSSGANTSSHHAVAAAVASSPLSNLDAGPSPVLSDAALSPQPSFLCREECEAVGSRVQLVSLAEAAQRVNTDIAPGLVASLVPTTATTATTSPQLMTNAPPAMMSTGPTASLYVTPPEQAWSLFSSSPQSPQPCGALSLARSTAVRETQRTPAEAAVCTAHTCDLTMANADVEDMLPLSFVDHQNERWYRVPQPIGAGAFAEVYKAIAASTGAVMAVKCIHLTATHVDMGDVVREVNVACKLYNDHVVNYVDWALVSSYLMILMEYVSGGSLRSVITTFPRGIPVKLAKRYASDALRGLAYLHRSGIVHADFKPQNILLTRYGRCKISDFGSSVTKRNALRHHGTTEDVFHLRGTPYYMSPEVAAGATPTMRSDIWGFGLTLYEMLTGRLPWVRRANIVQDSREQGEDVNASFSCDSMNGSRADMPGLAETKVPATRAALTVHRDPCASPEVRCCSPEPSSAVASKAEGSVRSAVSGALALNEKEGQGVSATTVHISDKDENLVSENDAEWVEAVGTMSEARFLQGLANHSVQVRLSVAALPSSEAADLITSCLQPNPARRPEAFELLNHPFFWA